MTGVKRLAAGLLAALMLLQCAPASVAEGWNVIISNELSGGSVAQPRPQNPGDDLAYVTHRLEWIDGSMYSDGSTYDRETRAAGGVLDLRENEPMEIEGFVYNPALGTKEKDGRGRFVTTRRDEQGRWAFEFFYDRVQYALRFKIGNRTVRSVRVRYGAPLDDSASGADYVPSEEEAAAAGVRKGATFVGWYARADLQGEPFSFEGRTMPARDLTLYAKYDEPEAPPCGTLTVRKEVVGDDAYRVFEIVVRQTQGEGFETMTDLYVNGTERTYEVPPGEYAVEERDPGDEYAIRYDPARSVTVAAGESARVTVTNAKRGTWLDKRIASTPANGEAYALGERIDYEVVVTNVGPVALEDVVVTDRLSGIENTTDAGVAAFSQAEHGPAQWTIRALPADGSATLTYSHTVTEDDVKARKVDNSASVEYGNDDSDIVFTAAPSAGLQVEMRLLGAPLSGAYGAGEPIEYEIEVTNAGNVTVRNLAVTGERGVQGWDAANWGAAGGTWASGSDRTPGTLEPGETVTFTASYAVTQQDIDALRGRLSMEAVASGEWISDPVTQRSEPVEGRGGVTAALLYDPLLDARKALQPESRPQQDGEARGFRAGEKAVFEITVENAGNTTQTNVTVAEMPGAVIVEDRSGAPVPRYTVVDGRAVIGEMKPHAETTVYAEYTLTPEDERDTEPLTNTATVTSDDEPGIEASADIPKEYRALPEMKLTMTSEANGRPLALGEEAAYTLTLANAGSVEIGNVTLTSALDGMTFVSVVDGDPDGAVVLRGGTASIPTLAVGQRVTIRASYTVTEQDILAGFVRAAATAQGDPVEAPGEEGGFFTPKAEASAEDATERAQGDLQIAVEPDAGNPSPAREGDRVFFDVTVTNAGNVTRSGVRIEALLPGAAYEDGDGYTVEADGVRALIERLGPGEHATLRVGYTVSRQDIVNGRVDLAVSGGEPDAPSPTPGARGRLIPEAADARLGLTKRAADTPEPDADGVTRYAPGDTVSYEIEAANEGNVDLLNVTVSDALEGARFEPGDGYALQGDDAVIEALGKGERVTIRAKYVVTEEDALAGRVRNEASASAAGPLPAPAWDDPEPTALPVTTPKPASAEVGTRTPEPAGGLSVEKRAVNSPREDGGFSEGETIRFEIAVRNESGAALTGLALAERLDGAQFEDGAGYAVSPDRRTATIERLEDGASATLYAAYTATRQDVVNGHVDNVVDVTAQNLKDEAAQGNVRVAMQPADARFALVKRAVNTPAPGESGLPIYGMGDEIDYEIEVTNTGNVDLFGVTIGDELEGAQIAPHAGYVVDEEGRAVIARLNKGERATVYARYTVRASDLAAGQVRNAASGSATGPLPDPERGAPEPTPLPVAAPEPAGVTVGAEGIFPELTVKLVPAGSGPYALGEVIEYVVTATNTGSALLTGVTVLDAMTGDVWSPEDWTAGAWQGGADGTAGTLEPGESVAFTARHTVTEDDVLAGWVYNAATATARNETEVEGRPGIVTTRVIPDDAWTPVEAPYSALVLAKSVANAPEGGEAFAAGDTVRFTITARNAGNVTRTGDAIEELLEGATFAPGEGYAVEDGGARAVLERLAPGETLELTAERVVTEEDVLRGGLRNEVAGGGGATPTPAPMPTADPGFAGKPAPTPTAPPRDDPDATPTPGARADVALGGARPGFELEKEALGVANGDGTYAQKARYTQGDTVTYALRVRNTGGVELLDVTVEDGLSGAQIVESDAYRIDGRGRAVIPRLLPGESAQVLARYTVTAADAKAGRVNNTATASATGPVPPTAEGEPSPTPLPVPAPEPAGEIIEVKPANVSYSLTKTALNLPERGYYVEGEKALFAIEASNTGDAAITDFLLVEALEGAAFLSGEGYALDGENRARFDRLEPGRTVKAQAIYEITATDVARGSVTNAVVGAGSGPDGMPAEGNAAECTVAAADERFTLTVFYYYADGSEAAPARTQKGLRAGERYSVTSPAIKGYTPTHAAVEGTMPAYDLELAVFYLPSAASSGPAAGPSGSGGVNSSSGSSGSGGASGSSGGSRGSGGGQGAGSPAGGEPEADPFDPDGVPLGVGSVTMNLGLCFD